MVALFSNFQETHFKAQELGKGNFPFPLDSLIAICYNEAGDCSLKSRSLKLEMGFLKWRKVAMCRFKNSRIRHENKMKILYGKHYPTWRKEAELRIQQLDNWINDPNTKILNLLFFVEEKIELLEALLEEN